MRKLYEIKDNLCEKLEEYGGKEITTNTLEIMEALSTTIKNIAKIIAMSEEENYSGRYSGTYGNSYGNSYGRNARRDSMGRYSRDDGMIEEMRNLANSLPSGQRSDMERLIHKMENM